MQKAIIRSNDASDANRLIIGFIVALTTVMPSQLACAARTLNLQFKKRQPRRLTAKNQAAQFRAACLENPPGRRGTYIDGGFAVDV